MPHKNERVELEMKIMKYRLLARQAPVDLLVGDACGWRCLVLRKTKPDGTVYQRRPDIEAALERLALLQRTEITERSKVDDDRQADQLPSECLLHFVRRSRSDNTDPNC
jgi:hypothetical protein